MTPIVPRFSKDITWENLPSPRIRATRGKVSDAGIKYGSQRRSVRHGPRIRQSSLRLDTKMARSKARRSGMSVALPRPNSQDDVAERSLLDSCRVAPAHQRGLA